MADKNKKIDLIANLVYPISVLLMELFWILPWINWTGVWGIRSDGQSILMNQSVIIITASAMLITIVLLKKNQKDNNLRIIITGCFILAVLLSLRFEYTNDFGIFDGWFSYIAGKIWHVFSKDASIVLTIIAALLLWLRGINLGFKISDLNNIYRIFIQGIFGYILLFILLQFFPGYKIHSTEILLYLTGFFFFGFISIVICHLYQKRKSLPTGSISLKLIRKWLVLTVCVSAIIIVLVFAAAAVFNADLQANLVNAIKWIWNIIVYLISFPLMIVGFIIQQLVRLFVFLFGSKNKIKFEPEDMVPPEDMELPDPSLFTVPPIIVIITKLIMAILFIGLVIFLISYAIKHIFKLKENDEIDEVHESLWNWNYFKNDLRGFFKSLGNKFQRKNDSLSKFSPALDDERLNISDIFRNLQWEAWKSGIQKTANETPIEYSDKLSKKINDINIPLNQLTDYYGISRYGDISLTEKQTDDANIQWKSIRDVIRIFRKSEKK